MTPDSADEATREALRAAPSDGREPFLRAAQRLEAALESRSEVVRDVPPTERPDNVRTFGHPSYDDAVLNFFYRMLVLADQAGLGELWLDPSRLPATPDAVERLSLEGVLAFLVTIAHGERISEGLIAACVESGTLLPAVRRLLHSTATTDGGSAT